ncbi:MAG: hypothetical protein NTX76_04090 [Alphaproteobacteria bacterium]|nr:hypothetical protein [Alphaproteobacteria bacterium]
MQISSNISDQTNVFSAMQIKQPADDAQAEKAAQEFEGMFFNHILKQMFEGVEQSSLWGDSHTSEILKPVWIDAMAQSCSNTGLGIAKNVKDALMRQSATSTVPFKIGASHDLVA